MDAAEQPAGVARILTPDAVAPVLWRNGAGSTRQLVDDPAGWRLSVAELDVDAAFSDFTGLDRVFLPLVDVVLTIDGEHRPVARGTAAEFRGEAKVAVELVAGPGRAVNLMTVRGPCSGSLTAIPRSEWDERLARREWDEGIARPKRAEGIARSEWAEGIARSGWDAGQSVVFVDLGEVVVEVRISYSS